MITQSKLSTKALQIVKKSQQSEITEHYLYLKLAKSIKNKKNQEILENIAIDELKHYHFWKEFTQQDLKPNKRELFFYYYITRIFGLTFGLRLMEKGESNAQNNYSKLLTEIPEAKIIIDDENEHEQKLIGILQEKKLDYIGSIVLGLNDALVELTGTLAGLTFAFQNNKLIGLAGLITGIAASLSMAASEYLSQKTELTTPHPLTSAIYTGITYLVTVSLLITPYLILENPFISLAIMLICAIIIILLFNFYVSIAKNLNFKHRFVEMTLISLGVSTISFGIGYLVRMYFGINI